MNKLLEYMPTELQYNPFAPPYVEDPESEYSGGESEPESIEDQRTKMLKNARASKVKKRKSLQFDEGQVADTKTPNFVSAEKRKSSVM